MTDKNWEWGEMKGVKGSETGRSPSSPGNNTD